MQCTVQCTVQCTIAFCSASALDALLDAPTAEPLNSAAAGAAVPEQPLELPSPEPRLSRLARLHQAAASSGKAEAWLDETRAALRAALDQLQRWVLPEVWRQLLQRLWTDALSRLRQALGTALFSPSEIGVRFCNVISDLLREMCTLVHRGGSGPSREWMQRRAAGLQTTLALRALSTPRLTEAYHACSGAKQLAPLALLAMRMDQPAAAALVSARLAAEDPDCSIAEAWLGSADGTTALAVVRALEEQQEREPIEDLRAASVGGVDCAITVPDRAGGGASRVPDSTSGSPLSLAAARKAQRGSPSKESEPKGARWKVRRRKAAAATDWTI